MGICGNGRSRGIHTPENRLDCYRLSVYRNGNANYKAYGKHTSEEFWTEDFLLTELIK